MHDYTPLYRALLGYWNEFAGRNGYPPVEKTNDRIRNTLKRRLRAEKDFLDRMPVYFDLIHRHCGGKDEFGKPLILQGFLRSTTSLRALREHHRRTGESLLNPSA